MDTSMKYRKAGIEVGIVPIKSLRAGWRRDTFQTQYPMWNCSWLPSKSKIISVIDTNMKYKKAAMEEGIIPIKSSQTWWRKETFQTQHPIWNCSWILWNKKIISVSDTSMKCKKAGMEKGIMPVKSLCAGWRREMLYAYTKLVWSCSQLQWKRSNCLNCQK